MFFLFEGFFPKKMDACDVVESVVAIFSGHRFKVLSGELRDDVHGTGSCGKT